MRFRLIFCLAGIWALFFSGRSPESAQTLREPHPHKPFFPVDQIAAESTSTSLNPPVSGFSVGLSTIIETAQPEAINTTLELGGKPHSRSHKKTVALGFGLSIAALWGFRRVKKRFHFRKKRTPSKKEPVLPVFLPVLVSLLVGILIPFGGLLLTSAILGLSAALFGKLVLALFCSLVTSAAVILVGSWIFSKTITTPSNRLARGLALVIFSIFIMVPAGLALGSISMVLFIMLFLSISVNFWLGMALWLITAATLVGGYAGGMALEFLLSNWKREPTEKQLARRKKRSEREKRKAEKMKDAQTE